MDDKDDGVGMDDTTDATRERAALVWFVRRAVLLFLALACIPAVELLLPLDTFTYRAWEALIVTRPNALLPGPFYPDVRLERAELGDLHRSGIAEEKHVVWSTDAAGFRTSSSAEGARVLLVGDSFAAGSSLTQDATLGAVLSRELGQLVYSTAPGSPQLFLTRNSLRPLVESVKVVVFVQVERNLGAVRPPPSWPDGQLAGPAWDQPAPNGGPLVLDRLRKAPMLRFLRARYSGFFFEPASPATVAQLDDGSPMAFMTGMEAFVSYSDRAIDRVAGVLIAHQQWFEARGVRFVFVGVPDKETVYAGAFGMPRPDLLTRLQRRLAASGVEFVDAFQILSAEADRDPQTLLFHRDDTHWNPQGVELVAAATAALLQTEGE